MRSNPLNTPIHSTEPISLHSYYQYFTLDRIGEYVELPVLEACRRLYQLGIRTVGASANKCHFFEGQWRPACILISMSTLSPTNKRRLQDLVRQEPDHAHIMYRGSGHLLFLKSPIESGSVTAGQISDQFCALLGRANLEPQAASWAIACTPEKFISSPNFGLALDLCLNKKTEPSDVADPNVKTVVTLSEKCRDKTGNTNTKPVHLTQEDLDFIQNVTGLEYHPGDRAVYHAGLREYYRQSISRSAVPTRKRPHATPSPAA